jgi:hypothetical protein
VRSIDGHRLPSHPFPRATDIWLACDVQSTWMSLH